MESLRRVVRNEFIYYWAPELTCVCPTRRQTAVIPLLSPAHLHPREDVASKAERGSRSHRQQQVSAFPPLLLLFLATVIVVKSYRHL